MHRFDKLRSMLSLLGDSSLDGQRDAKDRFSRAIRQLPNSTSILTKGLQEIAASLDAGLGKMRGLRDRISADLDSNRKKTWTKAAENKWVKKRWGAEVESTLSEVADGAEPLYAKFEEVRERIEQAKTFVRADWEHCTNQLASCVSVVQ